ncbi:MAG: hypothetical protein QQN41_07590, partial [Nitrosopumilus sp.]
YYGYNKVYLMNLVIGIERSGLSMVASALSCSLKSPINVIDLESEPTDSSISLMCVNRLLYQDYSLNLLTKLNLFIDRHDIQKTLWLTRNPITASCSYFKHFSWLPDKSLQYWHDVNCLIWYSTACRDRMTIKNEDLLLKTDTLERVFAFLGLVYNEQYRKYGDFSVPIYSRTADIGWLNPELVDNYEKNSIPNLREEWYKYKSTEIVENLGYFTNNFD